MNQILITALIGAVIGAVAGGVGYWARKKRGTDAAKASPRVQKLILGVAIGLPVLLVQSGLIKKWTAKTPLAQASVDIALKYAAIPEFKEKFQGLSAAEANALSSQLSRAGLRRLSDGDLFARARMIHRLALQADENTCAGLIMGSGFDPEGLKTALNRMTLYENREFLDLSFKAALLEIRGEKFWPVGPAELFSALELFGKALSGADGERFRKTLKALRTQQQSPSDDVCWLGRKLYEKIQEAEPDLALKILRGLVQ